MDNFPFTSRYLNLTDGKIHYIDEGQGEVILFCHGTPEWSYAYRHLIIALAPYYRCVAIDHLGFGYSDKPVEADYSIPQQARRLEQFIQRLGLKSIYLLANDFGVSIALSYALNNPQNVRRISISNGWMWSLKSDPHFARPGKLLQGWLGKVFYIYFNFSVKMMMPAGYGDKRKLTPAIHHHYIKPFAKRTDRIATLVYAREILNASDWWETQWLRLNQLGEIPVHIFWGMKDSFLRPTELLKWKSKLSKYSVTEIPQCGHFPHEETPEVMVPVLIKFFGA